MKLTDANPAQLVLWYITFLLSAVLHEAAHALAAMRGGDYTAYRGGQAGLDPLPHIRREPFGMVVLPVLSLLVNGWPFGFASTPYEQAWADRCPRKAALMALAGPIANLFLVVLASLLIWAGLLAGVFTNPQSVRGAHIVASVEQGPWSAVAIFLGMVFYLNLALLLLNLIPLPPLDGSAAVELLMGERTALRWRAVTRRPGLAIFGIFAAWTVFAPLFGVVFPYALRLLYPWTRYS